MSPTEPAPARKSIPQVDFELDDFDADEEKYLDFYRQVAVREDMLVPLAEHHTPNGAHSYYVLFDRTATYGHPGMPQYVAVHLKRDREKETFDFEQALLPLPAMAQSWLIHRGCPPDAIGLNPELGPPPADEATRALERRLAGDGDYYAMGYSYTADDPDDMVTVVALCALDERAPTPFRVVVEEVDTARGRLRHGGRGPAVVRRPAYRRGRPSPTGPPGSRSQPPDRCAEGPCSPPARPLALTARADWRGET